MPRRNRIDIVVPGLPHHVIIRGNNRRRIFPTDNERWLFLKLLARASERFECPIHQLTLMGNHAHNITTPPSAEALSAMMKAVLQPFAQRLNRLRDTTGKLFEQRYDSPPILDEAHLAAVLPYNDINPERAGITGPRRFLWTTHPHHTGEGRSAIPRELWTPSDWYLGLAATDAERQRLYREHVQRRREAGPMPEIDAREIDPRRGHRPRRPNRTLAW